MAPSGNSEVLDVSKEESNIPKRKLFDGEDSDSDDGGAPLELKVNEEFAKRFEHNKKREERQRLEEKYKGGKADGAGSDSESTDETEDEDAFLATEALDAHISETLNALRTKDPRIYDKEAKFFPDEDETAEAKAKREKPMRLKDYHRERFLAGGVGASDSEDDNEGEEMPKTYVQEQDELKKNIMAEINAAAGESGDEGGDGDFLKPKQPRKSQKLDRNGIHTSRARAGAVTITEEDVAKADENPELFLSNFMTARAWVAPDGSNWKPFDSDEEDSDIDRAEEFETAYNLRFEDPEKSNEVLKTYARDMAAARSVRREQTTGRKRQRELEKERKEQEKRERAEEKARLKKLKLEEAEGCLEKIKRTAGMSGKNFTDDQLLKVLDEVWEDEKWEEQMKKRFGDEYYAQDDDDMSSHDGDDDDEGTSDKKRKPKKPKWDDDIDIDDIVKEDEPAPQFTLSDSEADEPTHGQAEEQDQDEGAEGEEEGDEESRPSKKRKSAKDHKKDRLVAKKAAKQSRSKLEALVDTKMELDNPSIIATNPAKEKKAVARPFHWRETSPTSFGMTARDILLAPSDKALNQFAGIKKYATFKDAEAKQHERKRLSKKGRLRKWRREVFGKEFEKTGPQFGFEDVEGEDEDGKVMVVVEEEEAAGEKKKKKRKRGHKKASAEA